MDGIEFGNLTPFEEMEVECGPGDCMMDLVIDGMNRAEDGGDADGPAITRLVKLNRALFQSIRSEVDARKCISVYPPKSEGADPTYWIFQSKVEFCDNMPDNEMMLYATRNIFSSMPEYSRVVLMRINFGI